MPAVIFGGQECGILGGLRNRFFVGSDQQTLRNSGNVYTYHDPCYLGRHNQGYTHKLLVPNVVRLEAARAFIEETAERIDAGEGSLNTEGAIAKYMASEAGNQAAEASIQAFGGYGYTHEYMVEKISRDVRITIIYEGTSEIMEMTISRDRWQLHLKSRGQYYHERASKLEDLHRTQPSVGADIAALATHAFAEVLENARVARLTRHQHILLRLGELIAYAETAGCLARRAARSVQNQLHEKADQRFDTPALAAISRVFARDAALKVAEEGLRCTVGAGGVSQADMPAFEKALYMLPTNWVPLLAARNIG